MNLLNNRGGQSGGGYGGGGGSPSATSYRYASETQYSYSTPGNGGVGCIYLERIA